MESEPERSELEHIRDRILDSPELPMAEEKREEARSYDLRVGAPDQPSIHVTVEVQVRSTGSGDGEGSDGSGARRMRELELTPQIAVESPAGEVYFVAWNHVARTFALWLTRDSEPAAEGGAAGDSGPGASIAGGDERARPRSTPIDDAGESQ